MSLKTTTLAVSIHRDDVNAIYGETAFRVEIDDEDGGPFVKITSNQECDVSTILIDIDELELAAKVARKMVNDYEKANNGRPTVRP